MRPSKACEHYSILGSTYVMNSEWCSGKCKRECDIQNSTKGEVLFNITAFDLAGNNFTADSDGVWASSNLSL